MNRKSQITAFMLIGILMIGAFGMVFYLANMAKTSKVQGSTEVQGSLEKLGASESLKNYLAICISDSVKKNVDKIAMNGGRLNVQEGPDSFDVSSGEYVLKDMVSVKEKFKNIDSKPDLPALKLSPDYLEPNTRIADLQNTPMSISMLPSLCQNGGPNDPRMLTDIGYAEPCPSGSYGDDSIQKELTLQLQADVVACLDKAKDLFIEITGAENIETGNIQAAIVFGKEDLTAKVSYEVNVAGGKGGSGELKLNVPVNLRLKRLYSVVQYIINKDAEDVKFIIDRSMKEDSRYKKDFWDDGYMDVKSECPKCSISPPPNIDINDKFADVITVTDTKSIVGGHALAFRFVRYGNRAPVMEYIHKGDICSFCTPSFTPDISASIPGDIKISAIAVDPDEDEVEYSITGWEADKVDEFGGGGEWKEIEFNIWLQEVNDPGTTDLFTLHGLTNPFISRNSAVAYGYKFNDLDIFNYASSDVKDKAINKCYWIIYYVKVNNNILFNKYKYEAYCGANLCNDMNKCYTQSNMGSILFYFKKKSCDSTKIKEYTEDELNNCMANGALPAQKWTPTPQLTFYRNGVTFSLSASTPAERYYGLHTVKITAYEKDDSNSKDWQDITIRVLPVSDGQIYECTDNIHCPIGFECKSTNCQAKIMP